MTKTRDLADLGGGFIQAGTGAVQRTVESKLQDVVSVLDFIPASIDTATTDCSPYFQAAIDANRAIYIPYGVYRIDSTIVLSQPYSAIVGDNRLPIIRYYDPGNGPAIKVTAVPAGPFNQHSRVENLIVEARDSVTGDYWLPTFSSVPNLNQAGVAFEATAYGFNAVQRCTARNLRIFNFSVGFWNYNTVDQRIDDIRVQMAAAIPDTGYTVANKCIGYYFDGTPGGGFSPNASVEVTNCTFGMGGCPQISTRIGLYAFGPDLRDIWVRDCVFSQGDYGVWFESTASDKNIDIHLNRIITDQNDVSGIFLKNLSGNGAVSIVSGYTVLSPIAVGGAALKIEGCKGVSVTGGFQALGIANNTTNDKGIWVKDSTNVTVESALIKNCINGFVIDNSNYCSFTANAIYADTTFETAPTLNNGIQLLNGSSYNTIVGNSISGASPTYQYNSGIVIASGCPRNIISSNQFDYTTVIIPTAVSDNTTTLIGTVSSAGKLTLTGPTEGVEIIAGTQSQMTITDQNWLMRDMAEDGTATNCIYLRNGIVPATNPSLGGALYAQGGQLRYIGSSGTVTIIAPA